MAIALGALALRVGYVLGFRHPVRIAGDPFYYHYGANLLVEGKGFINPIFYFPDLLPEWNLPASVSMPAAQHAPFTIVALAVASLFGFTSFLDHQLWSCVVGSMSVVLIALVARRIAGGRAGLIAAVVAAIYPNLWLNDAIVVSETFIIFTTALVMLCAYRYHDQPSLSRVLVLGAVIGLAALTRPEAILFLGLVLLPLAVWRSGAPWRQRLIQFGAGSMVGVLVLVPWVAHNATRFEHPVLLTSSFEMTAVQANCDNVYYGDKTGYWEFYCLPRVPLGNDESENTLIYRELALDYVSEHLDRVPYVVFARLGRIWGYYQPFQQINADAVVETRAKPAAMAGLFMLYGLMATGVAGGVNLRRRRVPLSPLVAPIVTVSLAVALTFGQTRYRAAAEPALVVLGAVGLEAIWRRLSIRRGSSTSDPPPIDGGGPEPDHDPTPSSSGGPLAGVASA